VVHVLDVSALTMPARSDLVTKQHIRGVAAKCLYVQSCNTCQHKSQQNSGGAETCEPKEKYLAMF
jgi:hypothetical protein